MKSYIKGFVTAVIAVIIVVSLIPTLLNATGQVSGSVPILSNAIVGTVAGAGVIILLVDTLI
jgi:hypothetical protein